jgi:hypothetical protein
MTNATVTPPRTLQKALADYLAKKDFESPEVLAKHGVTSLTSLKRVADGKAEEIRAKIEADLDKLQLGIWTDDVLALGNIRAALPAAAKPATATDPEAEAKREKLRKAMADADALRLRAGEANSKSDQAMKAQVAKEFNELSARLKTDGLGQLPDVAKAGSDLTAALGTAISLLEKVDQSLVESIDKGKLSAVDLIDGLELFKGFLIQHGSVQIAPAGNVVKLAPSVDTERLLRAPGSQTIETHSYKSRKAVASARDLVEQLGASWSTVTTLTASGFVGSGVASGSVSVAAAGSREERTESRGEQSNMTATERLVRRAYVPQKTMVFETNGLRLSDAAAKAVREILARPEAEHRALITRFLTGYGSHIFTRYALGGVYVHEAEASSSEDKQKKELSNNLATAMSLAVEASASYVGIGGAATATSATTTGSHAARGQYESARLVVNNQNVDVSIRVKGGKSGLPMELWRASLEYNPQWQVIDARPEHAHPVWELILQSDDIPRDAATIKLVQQFKKVWHEDIYAVRLRLKRFESQSDKDAAACKHVLKLEQGYKIVSGGAAVIGGTDDQEAGHFLYESYPVKNTDGTWSWYASSREVGGRKDGPAQYKARLAVAAIAVFDPNNEWDVKIFDETTGEEKRDQDKSVAIPDLYILTGGGVSQTYSEAAAVVPNGATTAFLTASFPSISGASKRWTVHTKSHQFVDRHKITAYAIGIRAANERVLAAHTESKLSLAQFKPAGSAQSSQPNATLIGGGAAAMDGAQALYASWPASLWQWEAKAAKKAWATGPAADTVKPNREIAWPPTVALKFGAHFLKCVNRSRSDFYQLETGPTICDETCVLHVTGQNNRDGKAEVVFKGWNRKYLSRIHRDNHHNMEFFKDSVDQYCKMLTHSLGGNEITLQGDNQDFASIVYENDIHQLRFGKAKADVFSTLRIHDLSAPQQVQTWAIGTSDGEAL